ncbi:unnamed protein product [Calypogeia fissa]
MFCLGPSRRSKYQRGSQCSCIPWRRSSRRVGEEEPILQVHSQKRLDDMIRGAEKQWKRIKLQLKVWRLKSCFGLSSGQSSASSASKKDDRVAERGTYVKIRRQDDYWH